ncbi:CPBP family intramembrane glutamic endopeptidase [Salininema proteolyticum]|uniref:CPBP family intramembrane glutamic endopeptidase n=1 Tax=Salininema proteolyticum TaxID=1607685 RepID=A0ABV8TXP3_9ACTN
MSVETRLPSRTVKQEVAIVLALSLGASAIWSVISFAGILTEPGGLADSSVAMNAARAEEQRPWLDLARQLASFALGLAPAVLALHLLNLDRGNPFRLIGLDRSRPGRDVLAGLGLAAAIGVPGLGLYLAARELGFNASISASTLNEVWWAVPVLILMALKAALVEEVVGVGYLVERLRQIGWSPTVIILSHALLRGGYHLYQGLGGFIGNAVMGVVFALFYLRFKRTGPLVAAHFALDIAAFAGYELLADRVSWL